MARELRESWWRILVVDVHFLVEIPINVKNVMLTFLLSQLLLVVRGSCISEEKEEYLDVGRVPRGLDDCLTFRVPSPINSVYFAGLERVLEFPSD